MNNLQTYTTDNPKNFNFWLLSVEKVAKLIDTDPSEICFAKAEASLLQFSYSINVRRCSWLHLKEKIRAKFSKIPIASHASLVLIHHKQRGDESLTAFIYRWSKLLLKCCDMRAEHCRDKLKIDLFSSQLSNEKIARRMIRKHSRMAAHAFYIAKEEKKNYKLLTDSQGKMFTSYKRLTQIQNGAPTQTKDL